MRVFLSSVRKGLEEERDALPSLIAAIGHEAIRFEDFSAQGKPSREACLTALKSADVYLLLLGPSYGHRFDDTGQSPTHDEWVSATAAGIPRLVYKKLGVTFEPAQQEFSQHVSNYGQGVFRDSFSSTHELQTKVVASLRDLAQREDPLQYRSLADPIDVTWRTNFGDRSTGHTASSSMLEVHVKPVGVSALPSRVSCS